MIGCEIGTFSKDLLNNYGDLKLYLNGNVDLDNIKLLAENPAAICSLQGERGTLKTLSQYPIGLLLTPSLSILDKLVNGIGLKSLGSFFKIAKGHLSRDFRPAQVNGVPVVVPAINLPKMEDSHVYMCQDLPFDSIMDSQVRQCRHVQNPSGVVAGHVLSFYWRLFKICMRSGYFFQASIASVKAVHTFVRYIINEIFADFGWSSNIEGTLLRSIQHLKTSYPWALSEKPIMDLCDEVDRAHEGFQKPITFYNKDGICRGASQWFIHICLQSRGFFKDSEKWMKAVAEQFKSGIPEQGVLLQSLYNTSNILDHLVYFQKKSHKISHAELDNVHESTAEKINSLSPGIYETSLYRHTLVYIKLENGRDFTWDPNFGLLKHNATQLLDHIIRYYHEVDDPDSDIEFYRHRLFRWIPRTF